MHHIRALSHWRDMPEAAAPSMISCVIVLFCAIALIAVTLGVTMYQAVRLRSRAHKMLAVPPHVQKSEADIERVADSSRCTIEEMLSAAPAELFGVSVRRLAAALQDADEETTQQIMSELWSGHMYLERCMDREGNKLGKLAIISYRVTTAKDGFTLDAHALRCAVAAAGTHGINYLWLDCWAYRQQPPWGTYTHADFIVTLSTVMLSVDMVLWLPRSRAQAFGQYQYRVWCTFEAAMVQLRGLPVVMVGHDLSRLQMALVAWGTLIVVPPWWRSDGSPVVRLARYNVMFFFFVCVWLNAQAVNIQATVIGTSVISWAIDSVSFFAAAIFGWLWLRTQTGAAVMFARNGQRVLQTMLHGASHSSNPKVLGANKSPLANGSELSGPSTSISEVVTEMVGVSALNIEELTRTMPWLASYDRRDIIAITTVLDHALELGATQTMREEPNLRIRAGRSHGIALSIYYSALLRPSEGDAIRGRSVRQWLRETGIKITSHRRQLSLLDEASAVDEAPECYWLDSPPPMVLVEGDAGKKLSILQKQLSMQCEGFAVPTSPKRLMQLGSQLARKPSAGNVAPSAGIQLTLHEPEGSYGTPGHSADGEVTSDHGGAASDANEGANEDNNAAFLQNNLRKLQWVISPGTRDMAKTPAGTMYVNNRHLQEHRLIHGEQRLPVWNRAMARALLFIFVVMSIRDLFQSVSFPLSFGQPLMTVWTEIVSYLCNNILTIVFICVRFSNGIFEFAVFRKCHVPRPFYTPARLEYAFFLGLGGLWSFYNLFVVLGYSNAEWRVDALGEAIWLHRTVWLTTLVTSSIAYLYEAGLATIHSITAAVRHRDIRYAFACTAYGRETGFKVV